MNPFECPDKRILTHVCYAHVFNDALTDDEIVKRCTPDDPPAVRNRITQLVSEGSLVRDGEYCFLPGCVIPDLASRKKDGRARAKALVRARLGTLRWLQRLPFVKVLAVSGSVAWESCQEKVPRDEDVDLFLITAPSSLHAVRMGLRIAEALNRAAALLRPGSLRPRLCPNFLLEISSLSIQNPSFYTASDAVQARVLKGEDVYAGFLSANGWIDQYYRGAGASGDSVDIPSASRAARPLAFVNLCCFGIMALYSTLKSLLLRLPRQYSIRPRPDRANSLRRASLWGGGYQPQVAERFKKIYTRHVGSDPALFSFLFPGTSTDGVWIDRVHVKSCMRGELGYHE